MVQKSGFIIFVLLVSVSTAFSQFLVVPIAKKTQKKETHNHSSRIQALKPMLLPFWDDFSFSNSANYPHDTLWQYGQSVDLNFGGGIHPPSLGVVTFDGLDSLGKPYSINDPQAKGYADKLISRPINLDAVPVNLQNTVYLSFYYEPEGNGETPDPGDRLDVDFKDSLGQWVNVFSIQNDGTLQSDTFKTVFLPVDQPQFFHSDFQFRFRSFGRLSGPYDTWQVDYVYLNSGRYPTDDSFPDRAITTPMTSLFDQYWAIPKKHFITNIDGNLRMPSLELYNLSDNINQPINYNYYTEVITYKDSVATSSGLVQLEDTVDLHVVYSLTRKTATVATTPPTALFDPAADSFRIKIKFLIHSGDNKLKNPPDNGDYDSTRYKPIDFRVNDTTRAEYVLSRYYAYDDGSAEQGAALIQPGAQAAYRFDMKTTEPDTIVAVDIYFPRFGDETNQIILLRILSDLSDTEQSILHEENIAVDRSQMDTLRRYKLNTNTIGVIGSFYIGWKQLATGIVPIGFDKNTDSGNKISFNVNGSWEPNLVEKGSLMIHPVFGKGGLVTGLPEPAQSVHAFPNPNSGIFYLSGEPEFLEIHDLSGRAVGFSKEINDHQTRIVMNNAFPGLYVLKTYVGGKFSTQKILIRP